MNFNFLSLIKKNVKLQVKEKGETEGMLVRVFDDYLVIKDAENNKLLINKNAITCVINLSHEDRDDQEKPKLKY